MPSYLVRSAVLVLAILFLATAFFGTVAPASADTLDAVCSASPESAHIGESITITCEGFTPTTILNAYTVEPDGTADYYGDGKSDEQGVATIPVYTDFGSYSKEKIGAWTMVVEQTGLAKSVLVRGIVHYTILGGTEGVSGAALSADPELLHKAEVGIRKQTLKISVPGASFDGQLAEHNYVYSTVRGTGFTPGEIVTFWIDPPNGGCSDSTSHSDYKILVQDPPDVDIDARQRESETHNPSGIYFLEDAKADGGGAVTQDVYFNMLDCEGVYHVVGRGNTSGWGGETNITLIGNPIAESATLVVTPDVVSALFGKVTFYGSGFAPGEHISCWLTTPQGQTSAIPDFNFFNGTLTEGSDTVVVHDHQIIADASGQFSYDYVTGDSYTRIDGTYKFGSFDFSNKTFKTPYQSEGALGEYAVTCRGDTSGLNGIGRFVLTGNTLDP